MQGSPQEKKNERRDFSACKLGGSGGVVPQKKCVCNVYITKYGSTRDGNGT